MTALNNAIATHLNILESAIAAVEEWANVLFVRFTSGRPRFVSKKVKLQEVKVMETKTVRITANIPTASGRRRGWIKVVTSVDSSKSGGYALQGEFLGERETDIKVGTIVVRCCPCGSVKNGYKEYDFGIVAEDGINWDSRDFTWKTWLTFLDVLRNEAKVPFV